MQRTDEDPTACVDAVEHPTRKRDSEELLRLVGDVTGEPPAMWGRIVGLGSYHYRYASGHEGDFCRVGFAPTKARLAFYGLQDAPEAAKLLERLGKHKVGVGCVYVNKFGGIGWMVHGHMAAGADDVRPVSAQRSSMRGRTDGRSRMAYRCELVDVVAQPTLVVRTRTTLERLPKVLGPAWGAIVAHAGSLGAQPTGMPFVAYHNTDMSDLDVEIGLPFAQALHGEGDVEASEIPAGRAVATVHVGPYERIGKAYEAILAWLDEQGLAPAGPSYEHYIDDPADTPSEALRTRIVWPVASR